MLYRRCKSGDIIDEQSFPLILFLDVVFSCSVCAIYSCLIFAKTDYCLVCDYCCGIWCRPVRAILFKGLPNIPFSARLTSPLFLTLPPPPPFHTFVMLSLSLRGHTVTLFTGSHAGVKCVWMQVCVSLISLLPHPLDHDPNQIRICQSVEMHTDTWSLCLVGSNSASNLSINVHLCI